MQMKVPAVAPEALRSGTGMMKRGGALVTAGVAATTAVLGMHLAGGAGAWPPAVILGLSLFWAALFGVFGRRQSAVDAARWAALRDGIDRGFAAARTSISTASKPCSAPSLRSPKRQVRTARPPADWIAAGLGP